MPILKFENLKPKNFYKGDNSQGYSVNYIRQLNSLIIYGVLSTSDVYLFSLSKRQWTLIKTAGKKPSCRRFYAHYYDDSIKGLMIHGGEIIEKYKKPKSSDQCYILFIQNWQWRKIFLQKSPSPRQFHQIIFHQIDKNSKKQLLIFGGFSKPYQTFLNDIWSFKNFQSLSIKTNKHEVHGCESKLIPTKGYAPLVYGYSKLILNNQLLIFGGKHQIERNYLQIFSLCLERYQWQKIDILNKICPSLMLHKVYLSAIDLENIHIFGGIDIYSNRPNDRCYSLNLRQMEIIEEQKSRLTPWMMVGEPSEVSGYSTSCIITESPLCVGLIEHNINSEEQIQINIIFQKQPSSINSKNFETDQIQDKNDNKQIAIEEYLKGIKHEQILSQELIKKNIILEGLYKQIQRYISFLYINEYLNLPSQCINSEIEIQKQKNIENCQNLKQNYIQNQMEYEQIVEKIKQLRTELGQIHQDIQRCIQTQIDQEEQQ